MSHVSGSNNTVVLNETVRGGLESRMPSDSTGEPYALRTLEDSRLEGSVKNETGPR